MAIRNRLFSVFNTFHRIFNIESKFLPYQSTVRNENLLEHSARHTKLLHFAKKDGNYARICKANLDEFQKMEFDVLAQYNSQGANNQHVDPLSIVHQLDRIEVLKKLKILEKNASAFPQDEAECLKLIARVHLEEPNAQENLDKFIETHPQCRRLLYLGQI